MQEQLEDSSVKDKATKSGKEGGRVNRDGTRDPMFVFPFGLSALWHPLLAAGPPEKKRDHTESKTGSKNAKDPWSGGTEGGKRGLVGGRNLLKHECSKAVQQGRQEWVKAHFCLCPTTSHTQRCRLTTPYTAQPPLR
mmetsp:Transcript_52951/g.103565  ORF Transcript_52951/g.103565 Transcript_52951/m.103565 type:complete len:137 (+) Transcript_52951:1708-2118(+)